MGMAPGQISWLAAMEYADRAGLEPDVAEMLWYYVHAMDGAYLKHLGNKAQTAED